MDKFKTFSSLEALKHLLYLHLFGIEIKFPFANPLMCMIIHQLGSTRVQPGWAELLVDRIKNLPVLTFVKKFQLKPIQIC